MNSKGYLALAGGVLLSSGVATPAAAATNITGSVSSISFHNSDPGLVIAASALPFPSFTLNPGEFFDVDVLNIGTGEGTVNTNFLSLFGEDTNPYPISVDFSFTDPAGASGAPVSGSTFGFIAPLTSCGVLAGGCGRVSWDGPSTFSFGTGGQFSVKLFDATFGTPGSANVKGRFTLVSDSVSAVPEPSTWAMLLLGFGFIGGAVRSTRRRKGSVCYA